MCCCCCALGVWLALGSQTHWESLCSINNNPLFFLLSSKTPLHSLKSTTCTYASTLHPEHLVSLGNKELLEIVTAFIKYKVSNITSLLLGGVEAPDHSVNLYSCTENPRFLASEVYQVLKYIQFRGFRELGLRSALEHVGPSL